MKRTYSGKPRQTPEERRIDECVGARVREARRLAGMSQEAFAAKIGVTFQQIQKNERGTNRIGASRLWRMAQIFGVTPDWFYEGLGRAEDNGMADVEAEAARVARVLIGMNERQRKAAIGVLRALAA